MTTDHAADTVKTSVPAPAVAAPVMAGAPAAGYEGWMMLQNSIGNRAVTKLFAASQRASRESVRTIAPDTQQEIDALRGGGRGLDGPTRTGVETALGRPLPEVSLHEGPAAAHLSSRLGANAFTQGRDIFFSSARDPRTGPGQETLVHELTHVAEERTGAGTVALDEPNASVPEPAKSEEPAYTITLSNGTRENLSTPQAIGVLSEVYAGLKNQMDLLWGENAMVFETRHRGFFESVGAALVELAGEDCPDPYDTWKETNDALTAASRALRGQNVEEAGAQLAEADKAYKKAADTWQHYKDQLEGSAFKAQVEVVLVAVIAVTVIVAAAGVAAAAAGTGAAGAAGGGAASGGAVVGGGATAGGTAVAATVPMDAAAAGAAATGVDVGAATLPGAAAAVPAAAGAGEAAAAAGAGEAAAAAGAGAAAVTDVAADAVIQAGLQALRTGGEEAVKEVAKGASKELLQLVVGRLSAVIAANAPFAEREAEALRALRETLIQLRGILIEMWKAQTNLGGLDKVPWE